MKSGNRPSLFMALMVLCACFGCKNQGQSNYVTPLPEPVVRVPHYEMSDLTASFNSHHFTATSLDSLGRITGYVSPKASNYFGFGLTRAALWEDGKIALLQSSKAWAGSESNRSNSQGSVIGGYLIAETHIPPNTPKAQAKYTNVFTMVQPYPVLWEQGATIELVPSQGETSVSDINERGVVVGLTYYEDDSDTGAPLGQAWMWDHGHLSNLESPNNAAAADAININGDIVGEACVNKNAHPVRVWPGDSLTAPTETYRAVEWSGGKLIDLGTLPNFPDYSSATDINDSGEIVGLCVGSEGRVPFIIQHGAMKKLPLGSFSNAQAAGINSEGIVVGYAGADSAVIWCNGRIYDLNTRTKGLSGIHLSDAMSINDRGQILCRGEFHVDGRWEPELAMVLLSPVLPEAGKS